MKTKAAAPAIEAIAPAAIHLVVLASDLTTFSGADFSSYGA